MASDDNDPTSWSADPESASASGGHIAPAASSLLGAQASMTRGEERRDEKSRGWGESPAAAGDWDPLTAPLPSELDWLRDDERSANGDPVTRASKEWQDWGAGLGTTASARAERAGAEAADATPRTRASSERTTARTAAGTAAAQTAHLRAAAPESAARPERSDRTGKSEGAQVVRPERFDKRTSPTRPDDDRREAQPAPRRMRRTAPRPVRRTLKHIKPLSVLKLSLFFYAIFLLVWLMVVAVIYWLIEGMGLFEAIEKFGEGMALEWGEIDISLMTVERWALMIGGIFAIIASLVNVFLAFLYNVGADLMGGVEMTFLERESG